MSDDGYFDEAVARRYDDSSADMFAPEVVEPAVSFLAELAGAGRALELGIGTGRIALPLAARGVSVAGIDLSRAMVRRLRSKPGGRDLPVVIGDFATARLEGSFSLVYLVFNTILNLTSQAAQVACFRNAAAHLEPGGRFVIEVGIPELQRLPPGETILPFLISDDRWGFDEYDVANQGLVSHHFEIVRGRVHRLAIRSATSGRPSSTSWPSWPGCAFASAGPAGRASRSRARAASTSASGKSRPDGRLGVESGPSRYRDDAQWACRGRRHFGGRTP